MAVAYLAAYVITIVVPHLSSGRHTGWDEAGLMVAFVVLMTGPVVVLAAGIWAVAGLVARRRVLDRTSRAVLVSAAAAALLFLGLYFSASGLALGGWVVD